MKDLFHKRVRPFEVTAKASVAQLVAGLEGTAFQARNLAQATEIWGRMLEDEVTIFLGLAGAMVPAGLRKVIVYLIENRLIDCLVSTGANLFHDVYETLGALHWQHSPHTDDVELGEMRINRFYDVLAPETEFSASEQFIGEFYRTLAPERAYTTREYCELIGRALLPVAKEEGIITAAVKHGVPIYSPALGDSAHGIAMTVARAKSGHRVYFDIIRDVLETTHIATTAKGTGVIYLGGGTPKNFIQQAEVTSYAFGRELPGHRYGIQITMDVPEWGGLSGATFEEAQSWRKIAPEASVVTVHVEASVALPIIVSALAESKAEAIKKRVRPVITFEGMRGA